MVVLEVTDDGLDCRTASHLALDLWSDPSLLPRGEDFESVTERSIVAGIAGSVCTRDIDMAFADIVQKRAEATIRTLR
jgi:hypothetical protein